MKLTIYCLSIALAGSLWMNHVLAARVAVLQAYLEILIPR